MYLPLWDEWIEIVPICLIIDENHIAQITPVQVLPFIMCQVHYMDDSEMTGKTLELPNRLMTEVSYIDWNVMFRGRRRSVVMRGWLGMCNLIYRNGD